MVISCVSLFWFVSGPDIGSLMDTESGSVAEIVVISVIGCVVIIVEIEVVDGVVTGAVVGAVSGVVVGVVIGTDIGVVITVVDSFDFTVTTKDAFTPSYETKIVF